VEDLRSVSVSETASAMTMEDRMIRIDTLLCILFGGLTAHPLANTLIPPNELEQLRKLLPQEPMTVG
jgi:hypothetical protein